MNILVTGHRGFIGTNLFPILKSRFSDNIIGLDIKDGNDLLTCELPQADVIIHLAGLSGVRQSLDNPTEYWNCLLYTSPSPRDSASSRMPSSA